MSPTAVKGSLELYEPTSKPSDDLYTCDDNAYKAPEEGKDGVNGQTDIGPPKPQREHLSPTEDVNFWLQVDEASFQTVDRVISMLHNASLLYVPKSNPVSLNQI